MWCATVLSKVSKSMLLSEATLDIHRVTPTLSVIPLTINFASWSTDTNVCLLLSLYTFWLLSIPIWVNMPSRRWLSFSELKMLKGTASDNFLVTRERCDTFVLLKNLSIKANTSGDHSSWRWVRWVLRDGCLSLTAGGLDVILWGSTLLDSPHTESSFIQESACE